MAGRDILVDERHGTEPLIPEKSHAVAGFPTEATKGGELRTARVAGKRQI